MAEYIKKNALFQVLSAYTAVALLSGLGYFGAPWLSMEVMVLVSLFIFLLIYFVGEGSFWKTISALCDGLNSVGLLIILGHFSGGYIAIDSGFFPLPDDHWLYYLGLFVLGAAGKIMSDTCHVDVRE